MWEDKKYVRNKYKSSNSTPPTAATGVDASVDASD
jgi:hypothetical protein